MKLYKLFNAKNREYVKERTASKDRIYNTIRAAKIARTFLYGELPEYYQYLDSVYEQKRSGETISVQEPENPYVIHEFEIVFNKHRGIVGD